MRNDEKESAVKDEGLEKLIDALAIQAGSLASSGNQEGAATIESAVGLLVELHVADGLSTALIELQEQLIRRHVDERNHWKACHDNQVARARVLIERTDLPLERVNAFDYMGKLQTALADCRDAAARLYTNDDGLCAAIADPLAVPAFVREAFANVGARYEQA